MPNSIEFVCVEEPQETTRGIADVLRFKSKKIRTDQLQTKLEEILNNLSSALPDSTAPNLAYRIDTIEFSVIVDVKGRVCVLGSGLETGLAGGIKVVLKRSV
jgi:hypothetical protein